MKIMRKAAREVGSGGAKIVAGAARAAAQGTAKFKIFFLKKGCLSVLLVYLHTLQPEGTTNGEVGEWLKPVVC
jgi:hypothetical protein